MDTEKNRVPKTGMSRLLELAATKKPLVITSVILSILASVCSFIPYIAIYYVIRELLWVYPDFSLLDTARVLRLGGLAFGGVAANILLYFGALMCSHLAAFGTLYELKVNFASHLAKVPLGFHVIVGSGRLRKIMDENIEKIEEFIAHQLPDLAAALTAPVVMVAILLGVDWRFGLAALAGVVLAFLIQFLMYGKEGARRMMAAYQKSLEEMNNAAVEYIRGISVVKAFKQTVYSFRRLRDTIRAYTEVVIPYTLSWENSMSLFVTLINNIYLFIVPVGIFVGMRAASPAAFAGNFIFYLLFVPSIATVLMKVMYVNSNSMRIINGVEAMDALLAKPELPRPADPKIPERFDIEFDAVGFSYTEDRETAALEEVSFTAPQGQITAIVGPSGGGKSTIAHLIPRFFDVTAGAIRVGGVDIRDMEPEYLMKQVSFVFQDVFLFKQSVWENIAMGGGNTEATEEEIIAAAKAAQCHDFIMRLPKGYDTVIGTRGVHLSGGEKQRLAIARAIVKDAPVVVLDEATAFADPENEHLIQKAFEILMKNKTVVMIAHRLSTIRSADNIIVVDRGRVAEQGTHQTLLNQKGKYSAMWETYVSTASWRMHKNEEVHNHA
ncbi:ABC transporter ATP-binding protein [Breznakiella homolactica]|uniref:ABC transporter ATP-binding protein n=1 Tax=Breznakiella homolactica TaxID=2798577 RepID=A0A7T8BB05_9SPIR|nr:ABC transporter ATP-binding protein [Breznakiella homolactica]QQO08718.1 ABC transporter ATP-binding protein/permease [Breznakiella homolactica]